MVFGEQTISQRATSFIWSVSQEATKRVARVPKKSAQFVVHHTLDRAMAFKFVDEHTRPSAERGLAMVVDGYLEFEAHAAITGPHDDTARERLAVGALLLQHLGADLDAAHIGNHPLAVERVELVRKQAEQYLDDDIRP